MHLLPLFGWVACLINHVVARDRSQVPATTKHNIGHGLGLAALPGSKKKDRLGMLLCWGSGDYPGRNPDNMHLTRT